MTDISITKAYIPKTIPRSSCRPDAWLFVFYTNRLLVIEASGEIRIPDNRDLDDIMPLDLSAQYLGDINGHPCYYLDTHEIIDVPAKLAFRDLRSLLGQLDEDIFLLAGRAFQIANWNRMTKYCGKCGAITEMQDEELVKRCPRCKSLFYPRISPAVIVAVVRDDKILLAHNKSFNNNRYSVIAGFVEPGERFEDCVRREVMEEVGIRIKNISYFASQPWPFPDSLMVGFTAEYDSGEINVDGKEIDDAGWYSYENLPQTPAKHTIAGRLINSFVVKRMRQ